MSWFEGKNTTITRALVTVAVVTLAALGNVTQIETLRLLYIAIMSAILPRNYGTPTFLGYPVQRNTNRIKLYFHWQNLLAKLLALLCHKITSNSLSLRPFCHLGWCSTKMNQSYLCHAVQGCQVN